MRLCRKVLAISFKEKSIFRFDYIAGTIFASLLLLTSISNRSIRGKVYRTLRI